MLEYQEEITARVINSLNLFTICPDDYLANPYMKKLFKKYKGAIRRDIRFALKKKDTSFSPYVYSNLTLDIYINDAATFQYRLDKLIRELTIRGMIAYGICGTANIEDYVANIEFTLVKSLIGSRFEKERVWVKAIEYDKPNKISFASNRFGFKLSFNK